jgi:hypothetical protein
VNKISTKKMTWMKNNISQMGASSMTPNKLSHITAPYCQSSIPESQHARTTDPKLLAWHPANPIQKSDPTARAACKRTTPTSLISNPVKELLLRSKLSSQAEYLPQDINNRFFNQFDANRIQHAREHPHSFTFNVSEGITPCFPVI